jgi:hypothetical protein
MTALNSRFKIEVHFGLRPPVYDTANRRAICCEIGESTD